ncbi:MAG: YraN family protein [Aquificaceae bacterium]|nr:YraN family protein [Aquificaceae bacterium]MDW8096558.1 YraN family protein [Aquificaceae bacterium]
MRRGAKFEELAVKHLESLGYRIVRKNYHCGFGEIDIVALDGDSLVFVEVKGGKGAELGDPVERVTPVKLRRMTQCLEKFLQEHPAEDYRVELVVVRGTQVEHIKDLI